MRAFLHRPCVQSTLSYTSNLVGAANAASSLQNPFRVLPLPSSFPNFARLPGPPYTAESTFLVADAIDPDFKDATSQQYGVDAQYQHQAFCSRSPTQGPEALTLPCHGATTNRPSPVPRILSTG